MNKPTVPSPAPIVEEEAESGLSPEVIFSILRRFWFLIFLAALAGGAGAYYFAGKQNYVYQKSASLIMRDEKSNSDISSAKIMSELGIESGSTNIANETIILRSTAVMTRVVEDLKLNTAYWQKQDLREIELYKESPILVVFEKIDAQRSCRLSVTPKDEKSFSISFENSSGESISQDGTYGALVQLPFATVSVHPTSHMKPEWNGRAIIVQHAPALATAHQLMANLTVKRPDEKDSSLLEVDLKTHNPEKAEDALNKLIDVYNRMSIDEKKQAALKTQKFIEERRLELERNLTGTDKKLSEIKEESDVLTDMETVITADMGTVQALNEDIFNLETQIKLANALSEELVKAGKANGLLSVDTGLSDGAISRQIETYNEAYLEYSKISKSAGKTHPQVVALRERMNSTLVAANKALANYNSNLKLKLKELTNKRASLEQRVTKTSTKRQEMSPLMREHKVQEELYLMLLSKEQENAIALSAIEASARVLESAHGSNAPISPNTVQYLAAGTAGGAALCFFALLGIGMMNNKVKSKFDLAGITRQPIVAELPLMSKKEAKINKLFIKDDHSVIAECFHILRNNAANILPKDEKQGHIFMMTSTVPGEGKTFTTTNLAAAFAKAGRKVLLVDGDLRKASQTRALGMRGRRGLTSLLLNQEANPGALLHKIDVGNNCSIDFIGTGPTVPNPVTLLSLPKMADLLNSAKKFYDAIIIDTPPYGILADTSIWAALSDVCLYLIRSEMIDKRHIKQIQKLSDEGKLPNLSFVINGVDFKSASYYHYGYSYGYYRYTYGAYKKGPDKEQELPTPTTDKAK